MKTKSYFLGFLFLNTFCFSQQTRFLYYVEFKDPSNKPQAAIGENRQLKTLSFNNQKLEVVQYEEAFSDFSSQKLKNTSLIEFKTERDYNDFIATHQTGIVKSEKIDIRNENISLLKPDIENKIFPQFKKTPPLVYAYTPNDYYLVPDPIGHTHLDLINAREAWDYSKGDGVIVGVSDDGFRLTHREFQNKISTLPGQIVGNNLHGTAVTGLAGSNTDNNFGGSSIGFNNKLLVTDRMGYGSWNWLKQMSQNGARIINMSWLSSCSFLQSEQDAINEIYSNGTVLVAAAGNASCGSTYAQVFPASYKNVIAVSGVGHLNDLNSATTTNVKDVHYTNYAIQLNRLQNNEDVDIVAPAYDMLGLPYPDCDDCLGMAWIGTSLAAPLVSGTLSLLFSSNNCLSPVEAETILKLTSANIDHLPPNQIFAGLLGAGRLDAGKANKMAWQMNSQNGGEIIIEDKKFNRWDFELLNAPEFIRIRNESFTQNANVNFKAKKGITLDTDTFLEPGPGKSHFLYVENTNICSAFAPSVSKSDNDKVSKKNNEISKTSPSANNDISVYPIPAKDVLFIKTDKEFKKGIIKILDLNQRQILQTNVTSSNNTISIDVSSLVKGMYFIDITLDSAHYNKKIVKE
ncbi:S8 family serine peptidase (plasmid) [Chryseobacterium panacisoli]|uniref:S8 family serine peptidase n=1 Tax=Chryseobacterium panacisoli TaxID=1807141 RepID=A0A5D8ZZ98_9FLAO|nr:S8/S53 family peptidase [Chryseobacterium panacisoli]TZF99666.1 S8 family serine peptidase [Chryseobacterium panacisoli]